MKKGLPFALPFLAVVLAGPTTSKASDHIDGLKTAADNAADLTDVFAFTSPKDPSKLVLVMNVHGIAFSGSRFSNAVDYKFRVRPVDNARTLAPSQDPAKEKSIICSFSGGLPFIDANQRATCRFSFGNAQETISFDTRTGGYAAGGSTQQNGIKVFAGVRSDPWFLDLARTLKFNYSQPVDRSPGVNGLHGQNVLSIVVELDKTRFGAAMLAVTAQTVRK
jgi:hypothetical protein